MISYAKLTKMENVEVRLGHCRPLSSFDKGVNLVYR
jgi:hypothetical protein